MDRLAPARGALSRARAIATVVVAIVGIAACGVTPAVEAGSQLEDAREARTDDSPSASEATEGTEAATPAGRVRTLLDRRPRDAWVEYDTGLGPVTVAMSGPDVRVELTLDGTETLVFADDALGVTVVCELAGRAAWKCTDRADADARQAEIAERVGPLARPPDLGRALRTGDVELSDAELAGVPALCARISSTAHRAERLVCLANDTGILLVDHGGADDAWRPVTATSITTGVTEADFVPPA